MIAAGVKLLASEINDMQPQIGFVAADASRVSSTTVIAVTGLAVALDPDSLYALDGYIAYNAAQAGDLKIAVAVPTLATGSWGLLGVVPGSTANGGTEGDLLGQRSDTFGTGTTLAVGGSSNFGGAMIALPRGYIDTAATAGNVQVHFAQNTSSATATVIKAGSWLRAWKIA